MKIFVLKLVLISLYFCIGSTNVFANIYYVTNVNDSGAGSLRQCILDANTHLGRDTVYFNIAGSGPFVIKPDTSLPDIVDPIYVNGFSQPNNNDTTYSIVIQDSSYTIYPQTLIKLYTYDSEFTGLKFTQGKGAFFAIYHLNLFTVGNLKNMYFHKNIFLDATAEAIWVGSNQFPYSVALTIIIDSNYFHKNNNFFVGSILASPLSITITNNVIDSSGGAYFSMSPYINVAQRCILKNLVIRNNRFNQGSIYFESNTSIVTSDTNIISNINISNNSFIRSKHSVMDFELSQCNLLDSLVIDSNLMSSDYFSGGVVSNGLNINLDGANKLTNLFIRNNIIDSIQYGVFIQSDNRNSKNHNIINNFIFSNNVINKTNIGIYYYIGILAQVTSDLINTSITGNEISNCSLYGIVFSHDDDYYTISQSDSININSNNIHNCDKSGIYIYTTEYCVANRDFFRHATFFQNNIHDNGKYGIEFLNQSYAGLCSIRKTQLDHNIFSENSIHDNGNRGIKITDLADTINFNGFEFPIPVLDTMFYSGGQYYISGHINGEHLTSYKLEYFLNSTADTSGYGEGETFIGNDSVKTDSSGFVNFIYAVPSVAGACIAATATDYTHYNTSEFGNCLTVNLVGINEYSLTENHLLIYPNPAKESCLVKATNYRDATLIVSDYTGRIQQQLRFTEQTELTTGKLLPGVYLIEIRSSGMNNLKAKLIVAR